MPILDLTHPIEAGMPVFPGTQGPEIIPACTLEKDGFAESSRTWPTWTNSPNTVFNSPVCPSSAPEPTAHRCG